ncbi:uncharacterized protein LOC112551922 [Alligator sinensis]|uniref:Antimicrobial-peptide n=1 Tax=Alligator sinensis TaxID=38654 RepID=A0A2H4ZLC8_ALLSI|nr:uncharacterized protein LOC112551922 [Alligator sinensis]AUG31293.1 antimicrobial-peptide [Alligator sinensis]
MKLLFLLLGVTTLVFQAQAQDVVVAQDEAEPQDLDEMEEEAETEVMEAEDATGMDFPGPKLGESPAHCRWKRGVCRPTHCKRNDSNCRHTPCKPEERIIGWCLSTHVCCRKALL